MSTPQTDQSTKVVNVGFYIGYVESTRVGVCIFSSERMFFNTEEEAFDNLSVYLLDCYLEDFEETKTLFKRRSAQCSANHTKLESRFCPDCGLRVHYEKPSDIGFKEWLSALPGREGHTWHYDLLWNPYYDREYSLNMMPDNDYGGEAEICKRVKKLKPDALEWEDE